MLQLLLTTCALLAGDALSTSVLPVDLDGSWAGWLYMDDGDVPVRIAFRADADGEHAIVDLPAASQIGARFAVEARDDAIVVSYPDPSNARVRLQLTPGDDHVVGEVDWIGVAGRVELHRSERELQWIDPERTADLTGLWGHAPTLIVRKAGWGDLVLDDPATGAVRTLFATGEDAFVAGPAYYVPSPVTRELTVERDAAGAIVALIERSSEGERRLERRALLREPVSVVRDGVTLHGTLVLPNVARPACAVIAGGSSWTGRESNEKVATQLAAYGVASILYDKRGYGASGGARDVPFAMTAGDLAAFAELAREHPALDRERVGYLGISRGGWYGAIAAATDPRCAFFVDEVGPAVSPAAQETTARLDRMREAGATADELALGEAYLESLWEFARSGEGGDEYLRLQRRVDEAGWRGLLGGVSSLDPAEWAWSRMNADFDPLSTLRSIACPTLALHGEADLSVASRVNTPLMREVFETRADSRVVLFEGCDHGLRPVLRDADGSRVPFHRSPGAHPDVWPTIARFVHDL